MLKLQEEQEDFDGKEGREEESVSIASIVCLQREVSISSRRNVVYLFTFF